MGRDYSPARVSSVARAKGFDMVVEKSAASVFFAREGPDLTDEVIRQMDARK